MGTYGQVLVVGGYNGSSYLTSAELFDPTQGTNGTFSSTGSLATARQYHSATLMPTPVAVMSAAGSYGKVLIAGGYNGGSQALTSAEVFDPTQGTNGSFSTTGSMTWWRYSHTAALLPNGKVLVAGGSTGGGTGASGELYNPATAAFESAWVLMNSDRTLHTFNVLAIGAKGMVAGGNNSGAVGSSELYQ